MAPGTFILRPTSIVSGGSPLIDWAGDNLIGSGSWATDFSVSHNILDGLKGTISGSGVNVQTVAIQATFNDILRMIFFGPCIYLDGSSTPISFSSLPAGFTPLNATLTLTGAVQPISAATGYNRLYLQLDSFTEGLQGVLTLPYSDPVPSMLSIMNNGVGIRVSLNEVEPLDAYQINFYGINVNNDDPDFYISGTYGIQQSSQFTPVITNTEPVKVGSKITITSNKPFLRDVKEIDIVYPEHKIKLILDPKKPLLIIDAVTYFWINLVFVQTDYEMIFYIPFGFRRYSGLVEIFIVGSGTQFTGSVLAGVLEVLFADASGIYRLTEGQTNDILYFRDGYTTDNEFLFFNLYDEITNDNYFSIKQEKFRMLAQIDFEYDGDGEDFDNLTTIGTLRIPVTMIETEIPSPFVITGFLP